MLDFEVQRCTRRCHASGRELQPGEKFYSVLLAAGSQVVRHDYAEGTWQGPPEDALGWWQSEMPDPQARKVHWAPNDVMLHLFQQWEEQPERQDARYVLTLLMVRRRIFRLEEIERRDDGGKPGREYLVVYCPKKEAEYHVPVVEPTPERALAIQDELGKLLFSRAA